MTSNAIINASMINTNGQRITSSNVINGSVIDDDPNRMNIIINNNNNKMDQNDTMNTLMDKLRARSSQMKSWNEMSKMVKVSLSEKRHLIDINERSQLQKCLDTIQKNIRVTSLQSMVERLETICRQLGLKFSGTSSPRGIECFVHSEMYYVEVLLEPSSGNVIDCKVAHQTDPVSCPELTEVLQRGDFVEFTKHLEGLSAIYQINADKKNKAKAYLALHALEIDLSSLAELQNHQINDINNLVHKSPVGILEPRKGGHPMKLTYFVPPYDLIDVTTKSSLPLNADVILEKKLGYSATVCIESSSSHRLQHESLINTLKTPEGKNLPQFSALTNLNSTQLPACFVIKLQHPLPTSIEILKKITAVTAIEFSHDLISRREPLISLIAKQTQLTSSQTIAKSLPFYVRLPDQHHCYHMNESCDTLEGVLISSIAITHPTHVPRILVHLRQQVLFNVIISSCIRQTSKLNDITNTFEVTTMSLANISIQFEHPTEESLATVDLDLRDITNVKCKIFTMGNPSSFCTDDYASKVMQRCLSIPVTMRAIIRKCKERAEALREQMIKEQSTQIQGSQNDLYFASFNSSNGNVDSGGDRAAALSYLSQQLQQFQNVSQQNNNQQLMQNQNQQLQQQNLQRFLAQSMQQSGMRPQVTLQQFQQQQQQLLQQHQQLLQQPQQQSKHNAMLMSMLSDIPAANSQMAAFNLYTQQQQQQFQLQQQMQMLQQGKQTRKQRGKRKATNDIRSPGSSTGRSPKRKLSEDDYNRDLSTPDDFMETLGDGLHWSSDAASVCRPSSTPSSTASFTDTIGNIKQEPNVSSGGNTPTNMSDTVPFQFLGQRMPFSGNHGHGDMGDYMANDLPLYSDIADAGAMSDVKSAHSSMGINQSLMSKSPISKRTAKRMRSNDGSDTSGTGDEGHNEQQKIIKSLEDLHQSHHKDDFSKFLLNMDTGGMSNDTRKVNISGAGFKLIKSAASGNKSMSSGDMRRCSSAGFESDIENKRGNISSGSDDNGHALLMKKERKRKRAESVDSIKTAASTTVKNVNVGMSIESAMMPPPMITSTGDVSSSSSGSLTFMDISNAASLRPSTPNVNIKVLPSSTSASVSGQIKTLGKKSSTVSSTSGNDIRISKGTGNKYEKNSTLSVMLKAQRQSVPKGGGLTPDSDSSGCYTPSQSPKGGLSFKAQSKTKSNTSKSGSPRTKEHGNKLPLIGGIRPKSINLPSSTTLTATSSKSGVSSSSVSSSSTGMSSSLSGSSGVISSSKQQNTSKLAKISRKNSLTAVVDRLRQNADATGVVPNLPGQSTGESGKPESSSLASSRPDTTSNPQRGPLSAKFSESKAKYSRTSDQFTIKQNSGGPLKMSITKTKSSGSETTNKIGPAGTGLFKSTASTTKFTIPKLPKTNTGSNSNIGSSQSSANTTSTTGQQNPPIKRPNNSPNTKVTGGPMRGPGNVSSSTHPKGIGMGNKNTGVKIVSSTPSPNKNAALNRILGEKVKVAPSTSEPSSSNKPFDSVNSGTNISSTYPSLTTKLPADSCRPAIYSKFDGATVPMPITYSRSMSTPASANVSPQLPASTSTITQMPLRSTNVDNDNEAIEKPVPSQWSQQIPECVLPDATCGVVPESNPVSSGMFTVSGTEKAGVSSSSDVKASTSTPSSPAEITPISDVFQNPPPLIPTECIDECESEGGSVSIEPVGDSDPSSLPAIDSSESIVQEYVCPAASSSEQCNTNFSDTFNEVSTSEDFSEELINPVADSGSSASVSQSPSLTQTRRESFDVTASHKEVTVDEADDADGLIIDDSLIDHPIVRSSSSTAINETVSSSTSGVSGAGSIASGPQSPVKSSSPISSSVTPPHTCATPTPLSTIAGVSMGSVNSPSNHSATSSVQRPSPYHIGDIDDELMDEALVGSGE